MIEKDENKYEYRIRKLTPEECFKLMGLTKEDCDKCRSLGLSNSALYKIAGNGIVTNCVELISEHLYKSQYDNEYICGDDLFINKEDNETNNILIRGNYSPSNHEAARIVDGAGTAPCVKENHGTVTGVLQANFSKPQMG